MKMTKQGYNFFILLVSSESHLYYPGEERGGEDGNNSADDYRETAHRTFYGTHLHRFCSSYRVR